MLYAVNRARKHTQHSYS